MKSYTRAIAYRKGLSKARKILMARESMLLEASNLVREVDSSNPSLQRLRLLAGEADRCAIAIYNELDRLPKIRGKKYW